MSSSRLLDLLPVDVPACCTLGFLSILVIAVKLSQRSKLDAIPSVGSNSWLGSRFGGITCLTNVLDVIQEGYEKHKRAPFKVPALFSWMVIISSPQHVEELRGVPEDTLSFVEGINDQLQTEYTMSPSVHHNPYHVSILRSQLTRNIGTLYPEIRNEIVTALDDVLDLRDDEWKSVPALGTAQQVICRTSQRLFVGLPLCRDPDWIDLNVQYAFHVSKGAMITRMFPNFLKPLIARLFTKLTQNIRRGREILGPIIEERQKHLSEYGNQWADKPNDLLSWLMEEAEGPESTTEALTIRVLAVSFVAIHTTSSNFTNALFYLAANPQYVQPLREEVEGIVYKEGWTKAALGRMQKIDSFLKECERMEGFSGVSLIRKAMKDFTFSDGTFIPKGTLMVAATRSVHYDAELYPNAHVFEPFRFTEMRKKHHFVSTTTDYLAFGHGRHACPGRFFAANVLKSMLAHVVVTYDIKLEDNMTRPETLRIGTSTVPDPSARVMFRKRAD